MINSLLQRWLNINDNERKATLLAFLFVFTLMAAYYVLRPVRDALASDWTDAEVSTLWTINFFFSTALVAAYGFLVARVRFTRLVPSVYLLFAMSFVGFYFLGNASADNEVLLNKSFYVWVSLFALFHVSVFWSFMADTFNRDQAARLFGALAAGASLGAIAGPFLSGLFAKSMGIHNLMLLAAILLLLTLPMILTLQKLKHTELGNADLTSTGEQLALGGNPLQGFKAFFSNPYLLGIGVFLILYTGIGSFVYLEQKNLLAEFDRETRTMIIAYRDVIVNITTFVLAFFVTGRLVSRMGMTIALPLVPVLLILGMLILAFAPLLIIALALHIVSKAGNYGLTRPAREMLFTQVSREDRFKTKPVIDIVAYRGGDVIMGWFFTGLTQGLGLGMAAVAGVGAIIASIWAFVAYRLAKYYSATTE